MSDGQVVLPNDPHPTKSCPESWPVKEEAPRLNEGDKPLLGFLDESKDQVAVDSSIPLSPQWLHTKPGEVKDIRVSNSLSTGNPSDLMQKESWRLDGPHDKEWRKTLSEADRTRHWHEEERETMLLGRRERRKEGDRENEYRKNDRRADIVSTRENTDSKPSLQSSERWHDALGRSSGHEVRRDSKWSSRWGPEDKDKDSRAEKRSDVDKEDACGEKQPAFVASIRVPTEREADTRERWRPRHRQETHTSNFSVYRAAPGFGLERGRGEASVGFAQGRGRGLSLNRPSSSILIGAACSDKSENGHIKLGLLSDTFLYPRGKLLDIYRKQKLVFSSGIMPDGLEELYPITQSVVVDPLAFVAPDAEEEAVLEDIWNSKSTTNSSSCHSIKEKIESFSDNSGGEVVLQMERENSILDLGDNGRASGIFLEQTASEFPNINAFLPNVSRGERRDPNSIDFFSSCEVGGSCHSSASLKPAESSILYDHEPAGIMEFLRQLKFADSVCATPSDGNPKLPDDLCSLFDLANVKEISGSEHCKDTNVQKKHVDHLTLLEDLSLFYRDPQGEIQGPFLGVDIVSWFEQGFFGTDLPVCLSDAPEGTPFRELGEVIPHLKLRPWSASRTSSNTSVLASDCIDGNMTSGPPTFDFSVDSSAVKEQGWATQLPKHHTHVEHHFAKLAKPSLDGSAPSDSGGRNINGYSTDDGEEILYFRRPENTSLDSMRDLSVNNLHDPFAKISNSHFVVSKAGAGSSHEVSRPKDNSHMYDLLWSELEGVSSLRRSQSCGSGDIGHFVADPHFGHTQNSFGELANDPHVADRWADRLDANSSTKMCYNSMSLHNFPQVDYNLIEVAEHLPAHQAQKLQMQPQHLVSTHRVQNLNGSILDQLSGSASPHGMNLISHSGSDVENLWNLQLQRHREFLLQQQQLQQQQQLLLHHQQLQLQERQQMMLEQLLQKQRQQQHLQDLHHVGQIQYDMFQGNPQVLDQMVMRQQLFSELQQQQQNQQHRLQYDPVLDQLMQAKYENSLPHDTRRDLLELLSHRRQSLQHVLPPENEQLLLSLQQQHQQQQLQQTRFRLQDAVIQEQRPLTSGAWMVDEYGQFVNSGMRSARFSPVDTYYQHHHQLSSEQPGNLLHRRQPVSVSLENSLSLLGAVRGAGVKVDQSSDSLAWRFGGMELQEEYGKMDSLYPGSHLLQPQNPLSHQEISPLAALGSDWSELHSKQLSSDWNELQLHQLQLEAEQSRRETARNMTSKDESAWILADFLEKSGVCPNESLDMGAAGNSCTLNLSSYGQSSQSAAQVPGSAGESVFSPLEGCKSFGELPSGRDWGNPGVLDRQMASSVLVDDGQICSVVGGRCQDKPVGIHLEGGAVDPSDGMIGNMEEMHETKTEMANRIISNAQMVREQMVVGVAGTTTEITLPEVKRDFGGGIANQAIVAPEWDVQCHRASSCSDADVDTSFTDMKGSKKVPAMSLCYTTGHTMESLDGGQGMRSGKKKGKKGRQIDPALLGFKVSSNRMLMGEIQRPDD